MTQFVIDASVAAKWFLPPSGEPLAVEALRLLAGYYYFVMFCRPEVHECQRNRVCQYTLSLPRSQLHPSRSDAHFKGLCQ